MNPDAYLTRAQAAMLTGVNADTIGKWHARGWMSPTHGRRRLTVVRRRDGTLRYRLGDLIDAESDTRLSPFSSRSPAQRTCA